jgi:hypothetical protein
VVKAVACQTINATPLAGLVYATITGAFAALIISGAVRLTGNALRFTFPKPK